MLRLAAKWRLRAVGVGDSVAAEDGNEERHRETGIEEIGRERARDAGGSTRRRG